MRAIRRQAARDTQSARAASRARTITRTPVAEQRRGDVGGGGGGDGGDATDARRDLLHPHRRQHQVRSIHWFPYDHVGVVNADP
jgi:hypothetical protein